jgi:hypothetical protein
MLRLPQRQLNVWQAWNRSLRTGEFQRFERRAHYQHDPATNTPAHEPSAISAHAIDRAVRTTWDMVDHRMSHAGRPGRVGEGAVLPSRVCPAGPPRTRQTGAQDVAAFGADDELS